MQYRKSFHWDQHEKKKVLLNYSYNFHRNSILSHLECLNRIIDEYSKTYDNFIFMKGFNIDIDENFVKHLCDINFLKSLIKVPTNSKNPDKPICIDVILLNRPNLFQHRNQCFWNRSFRLPLFNSNWIQN